MQLNDVLHLDQQSYDNFLFFISKVNIHLPPNNLCARRMLHIVCDVDPALNQHCSEHKPSTLVQHCINVIQNFMFCACWVGPPSKHTKHLYNIYTTSAQRLRRWSNIV